jgi:hypothetical protein
MSKSTDAGANNWSRETGSLLNLPQSRGVNWRHAVVVAVFLSPAILGC